MKYHIKNVMKNNTTFILLQMLHYIAVTNVYKQVDCEE